MWVSTWKWNVSVCWNMISAFIWFLCGYLNQLHKFSVSKWLRGCKWQCELFCVAIDNEKWERKKKRWETSETDLHMNDRPNAEPIPAELTCQLHKFCYHHESNVMRAKTCERQTLDWDRKRVNKMYIYAYTNLNYNVKCKHIRQIKRVKWAAMLLHIMFV